MAYIFITYGDEKFSASKERIIKEANESNVFDEVLAYSPNDVSFELKMSPVFQEKRGGGLWSWKPDIILQTINSHYDGDIIVYADAGCTVGHSKEWYKYFSVLKDKDIIASKIWQVTEQWTRKEIFDYFSDNLANWGKDYQFQATIILKISPFTRKFIKEWRTIVLNHPEFLQDVPANKLYLQNKSFRENRHDQAVYSALLYKYLNSPYRDKICTMWEHLEGYDIIRSQALRATRIREHQVDRTKCFKVIIKTFLKQYIIYPWLNLVHKV